MNTALSIDSISIDAKPLRSASVQHWAELISDIYKEQGIVLFRDLIANTDIAKVQAELSFVIGLAISKLRRQRKLPTEGALRNAHRFDAGMLDLCAADRTVGGEVFRVAKKLLSVQRLTTCAIFENISAALIGTDKVALHPMGTNVRADHPGETHYLYPWHQDYLYNLGSEDSVTFWSPLIDVDDVNGCILIAPGSHKCGIFPVRADDPLNQRKNSAQSFSIANLDGVLVKFAQFSVPMKTGDVVAFHGNLLHSSQPNRSDGTRWSMQFRYFNIEAPDAIERGWPGGAAEGFDFTKYHPEAIVCT
ncbi:MAG: phytanoyl-CoA dioxygenase family protein [Chthoniobacteraceae bacterium]